ncbi:MAG: GAF domain-containing protein [Bacteroidia bacterium]|nr:GAF domain-containing protein [Bacteroidia bacterium]NNC86659.1 GAF domain-containing protein [Bacteroidia bacterium]NNM15762.1 GAF domain-containing protein [Bacteroidia bacterium]
MAEDLIVDPSLNKEEKYKLLAKQLCALTAVETNMLANYSNIVAALKVSFNFLWVGIYFVEGTELVLGPFQGPVACTRIALGQGVCGTSFEKNETVIVDNVDEFPGHIACSSLSKSEIVLPICNNDSVFAVLDLDSSELSCFDSIDKKYLEEVVKLMEEKIN